MSTQEIIQRRNRFMSLNYPRYPIAMVRGEGSYLLDADGKRYLDLFAGFGAGLLGHCHPDLVKAVTDQAGALWHAGNLFHTEPQTLLAEAIARHGFGGRSFFCHSGADANEGAIKAARLYGKAKPGPKGPRFKVITFNGSFHGRTFGTMVATAQPKVREGFEPLLEGFVHVPFNDVDAVTGAIDDQTVAVMVEPIQGEGGVNVPDHGFLPDLRALCDRHDLLMICDEVWTGCGRTGKWFAHQHWGVEPDMMTLAKGVGGGLAVGVLCLKDHVADLFDARKQGVVRHATTLGGNCVAMAVGHTIFRVIARDHLLAQAQTLGDHVSARFQRLAEKHGMIKAVRGKGLFVGVELAPGVETWFKNGADVVNACMERGVLINSTQTNVLRLAPALTVTREQLDQGLSVIEDTILHG